LIGGLLTSSLVLLLSGAGDTRIPNAGLACSPDTVYNENPSPNATDGIQRMHPLLSRIRWADAVHNEQWELTLRGLRDEAAQALAAAGVDTAVQKTFLAELDQTIVALAHLPNRSDPGWAAYIRDSVQPGRFQPIPTLTAYQLFRGGSAINVGAVATNIGQAEALCWSAFSIDQVLRRLNRGLEAATLVRLGRFNTSWANYRAYGYTRQPLELFLFRRGATIHDTLPRRAQWLLGHLSVGQEVRWSDSTTTATATVIEVVGGLRYWRDYTQYSGASVIISLPSGGRPGYGGMAHFARSLRAGGLVRRVDKRWRPGLVVSADLYGLLDRSKRSVDQAAAIARGRVLLSNGVEK
jgi:hypothetical protein